MGAASPYFRQGELLRSVFGFNLTLMNWGCFNHQRPLSLIVCRRTGVTGYAGCEVLLMRSCLRETKTKIPRD
jgi:hypothetical protein